MIRAVLLAVLTLVGISVSTEKINRDDLLEVIRTIDRHNQNPNKTFHLRFSDISLLTPEEYKQRLGVRAPLVKQNATLFVAPEGYKAPDSFDWRERGAVTRVKDQGYCGSCWAFATVGTLEGAHAIKRGGLLELSEQNLVDCADEKYGNHGCMGGWMANAYTYIEQNGGIDTEESYPYVGRKEACHFNPNTIGEKITRYENLLQGDEENLKNVVAERGPVAVAIDAGQPSFQHYGGGVYNEPSCSDEINHGVVVVGYGTDPVGGDYWLVKNSWNVRWGEGGYIRMARNRGNQCAIASYASMPILD